MTGNISLAGTLRVPIEGFFAVSLDTSFNILDFANLTGIFSTIELPNLPGLLEWDTTQLYTNGILAIKGPPSSYGDYNENGFVDAADYVVWRKNGGTQAEYNTWRAHFGQPAGSGSGAITSANAAVPEPTSRLVLILGTMAIFFRRRAVA